MTQEQQQQHFPVILRCGGGREEGEEGEVWGKWQGRDAGAWKGGYD